MSTYDKNMALTGQPPKELSLNQKIASLVGMSGLSIFLLSSFGINFSNKALWLIISLSLLTG